MKVKSMLNTILNEIKMYKKRKKKIVVQFSCTHTLLCNSLRPLVFSPTKNGFKSVISIFCCSVSVGNNSLHFQTLFLPLIVIIQ